MLEYEVTNRAEKLAQKNSPRVGCHMRFGSVCSGIEAASVAWGPLGWKAAWLAEIEPFPAAVLAHRHPEVPNLGDMTTLPARIAAGEVEAPEVFCGGTPCQAFSVAGLRKSLDDARGNLSLVFCEIANVIDTARTVCGQPPAIIFYENVPGVLSTKDNAFGCFLAGLAGEDDPLVAPGGKWTNAGCVFGPQRTVAWRVLDAQYFGVAQRRRRVFVVASAREGFDPAAVLFESEGVRRDTAPSREARQTTSTSAAASTGVGGLGTDFDLDGGLIDSRGAEKQWPAEISCTLDTTFGTKQGLEDQHVNAGCPLFVPAYAIQAGALRTNPDSGPDGVGVQADHAYTLEARAEVQVVCTTGDIAHTLKAEGFDASEDGTGRGTPPVPVATAIRTANTSANGHGISPELAHTLDRAQGQCVAFDTTQITSAANPTDVAVGVTIHGTHPTVQKIASYDEVAQCLRARTPGNIDNSSTTVVQQPVAFQETAECLTAAYGTKWNGNASATNGSLFAAQPRTVGVFYAGQGAKAGSIAYSEAVAPTLKASDSGTNRTPSAHIGMQVRRLTPVECERLQGFPDNYTAIPWRKKPADLCPDGPRYKALGNSWAVPNVAWIGARIQRHLAGEL